MWYNACMPKEAAGKSRSKPENLTAYGFYQIGLICFPQAGRDMICMGTRVTLPVPKWRDAHMKKMLRILAAWILTLAMLTGSCAAVYADDWDGGWDDGWDDGGYDEGGDGTWDEGGGGGTAPSASSSDGVSVSVGEEVFPSGTSMKVVRVSSDNGYNPDAFKAYTGSDPVMYDVIFTNDSGSTEPSGSYTLTFTFSGQLTGRGLTYGGSLARKEATGFGLV